MLTPAEIAEILKNPASTASLQEGSALQKVHKRIVLGEGYLEDLLKRKFVGQESDTLFNAKVQFCSPVTPALMSLLRAQFSNVFTADGFNEQIKFNKDSQTLEAEARDFLNTIWGGKSLFDYMQDEWFGCLVIEEFNGIVGIELPETGPNIDFVDAQEIYPELCYFPVEQLHDILEDEQGILYVVIKLRKVINGEEVDVYRFIDRDQDTQFIKQEDEFVLNTGVDEEGNMIPDTIMQFPAGKVPFTRISGYKLSKKFPETRVNFLHPGVGLAAMYQDIKDDHVIGMKKHANPLFYSWPVTCPSCNGTAQTFDERAISDEFPDGNYKPCRKCGGNGVVRFDKGDVTQGIALPLPDNSEGGIGEAKSPAGFVKNDIESLKAIGEEKEVRKEDVEQAVLGVTGVIKSDVQQTATEIVMNWQPVISRWSWLRKEAERVENFLALLALQKKYGDRIVSYQKRYGREYLTKTPQQIYAEYKEAKEAGLPDSALLEYLKQYIKAQFANNPEAKMRAMFLLDLEPFPTYTTKEVDSLGMADEKDVQIKLYFNDLIEAFERKSGAIENYQVNLDYNKRLDLMQTELESILVSWNITPFVPPDSKTVAGKPPVKL